MSSATSSTDSLAPTAIVAPFVRDATTWLSYFACFYLFSIQASIEPAMPYVCSERRLSYTVAGLHFTAVAMRAAPFAPGMPAEARHRRGMKLSPPSFDCSSPQRR